MTIFKDKPEFIQLLVNSGFKVFTPGHSASNGYDIYLDEIKRRVCFYDNRIFKDEKIEFRVMDYNKKDVFKKIPFFNVYIPYKSKEHRYGILSIYFESEKEITSEVIAALIKISKELK